MVRRDARPLKPCALPTSVSEGTTIGHLVVRGFRRLRTGVFDVVQCFSTVAQSFAQCLAIFRYKNETAIGEGFASLFVYDQYYLPYR